MLTLQHRPADRIPVDFWASAAMIRKLEQALRCPYAAFLDRYDVDFRYLPGPRYIGPALPRDTDLWGVQRTRVRVGGADGVEEYDEATAAPLAEVQTVADVNAYPHWPRADWFDYSGIADQCAAIRREERVVVFMGDRLNRVAQLKPAMYLRGMEAILTDLVLCPEVAVAILGRIREFYLAYLERILQAAQGGIDIVLTGDDFGAQQGLLVSREMWREFLGPGFREYLALAKAFGAITMHHTCGAVAELIPDFIAAGLDVLQSLQPEARGMAVAGLVERFGGQISFHGGISIQRTLPRGRPEDIRAEVRSVVQAVRGRGGYIFCTAHNIQADTPVENVLALLEAYREYGGNGVL